MDIYSKGEYPSNMLSNFAPHEFEIDGVKCSSMEGFLQSLKYRNVKKQAEVCALVGEDAERAGQRKHLWKLTHNVWWQGRRLKRTDSSFDELLDRAYSKLSENPKFAQALLDSGDEILMHSIGSHNKLKTILTEEEFVLRLTAMRSRLQAHPVCQKPD